MLRKTRESTSVSFLTYSSKGLAIFFHLFKIPFSPHRRRDVSILIGNSLDHFDIALYSFLAPVLAPLFFPNYEPVVQLILAYGVAALSFITEPLGVFIFGRLAKNKGPAFGLSYSLMGVALSTVLMGFLPGYDWLGYGSPLCLVVLRIARAICASGESTISRLYIMDGKTDKKALVASYWYHSSTMFGIIMASGLATLIIMLGTSHPEIKSYGWRLCFILGGLTGFFGYYLRRFVPFQDETKDQETIVDFESHRRTPAFLAHFILSFYQLWHHRVKIIMITAVSSLSYMTYTIPFVFMNTFAPLVSHVSLETMMSLNTSLLIFDTLIIPFVGRFTANYKPKKVLLFTSLVLSLTMIPLFHFMQDASVTYIAFVRLWIVFWGVVFLCPLNYWCRQQFQGPDQYFLIGMGNAFGAATLGRMATPVCLWLWHVGNLTFLPALYVTLIAFMAFLAVSRIPGKDALQQREEEQIVEKEAA